MTADHVTIWLQRSTLPVAPRLGGEGNKGNGRGAERERESSGAGRGRVGWGSQTWYLAVCVYLICKGIGNHH